MNFKHGLSRSPEYLIYKGAKKRCENPNAYLYERYGGRGIEFRFTDFPAFLSHIGSRPSKEFTLNRIDNDGHYDFGNVEWATRTKQNRNTSQNHIVVIRGVSKCFSEWLAVNNIRANTAYARIQRGWCDMCACSLAVGQSCSHKNSKTIPPYQRQSREGE